MYYFVVVCPFGQFLNPEKGVFQDTPFLFTSEAAANHASGWESRRLTEVRRVELSYAS